MWFLEGHQSWSALCAEVGPDTLRCILGSELQRKTCFALPESLIDAAHLHIRPVEAVPEVYAALEPGAQLYVNARPGLRADGDDDPPLPMILQAQIFACIVHLRLRTRKRTRKPDDVNRGDINNINNNNNNLQTRLVNGLARVPRKSDREWLADLRSHVVANNARRILSSPQWAGASVTAEIYLQFAEYVQRLWEKRYEWRVRTFRSKPASEKRKRVPVLVFKWNDRLHFRDLFRDFYADMQVPREWRDWIEQNTPAGKFMRCYFAHVFCQRIVPQARAIAQHYGAIVAHAVNPRTL